MHSSQHGPMLLRSSSTTAQGDVDRRASYAAEYTKRSVGRRRSTPSSVQVRRARRQAAWEARRVLQRYLRRQAEMLDRPAPSKDEILW
ncbi:MAG: hypothetical protein AAF799_37690 [Myxococcota bacterium]